MLGGPINGVLNGIAISDSLDYDSWDDVPEERKRELGSKVVVIDKEGGGYKAVDDVGYVSSFFNYKVEGADSAVRQLVRGQGQEVDGYKRFSDAIGWKVSLPGEVAEGVEKLKVSDLIEMQEQAASWSSENQSFLAAFQTYSHLLGTANDAFGTTTEEAKAVINQDLMAVVAVALEAGEDPTHMLESLEKEAYKLLKKTPKSNSNYQACLYFLERNYEVARQLEHIELLRESYDLDVNDIARIIDALSVVEGYTNSGKRVKDRPYELDYACQDLMAVLVNIGVEADDIEAFIASVEGNVTPEAVAKLEEYASVARILTVGLRGQEELEISAKDFGSIARAAKAIRDLASVDNADFDEKAFDKEYFHILKMLDKQGVYFEELTRIIPALIPDGCGRAKQRMREMATVLCVLEFDKELPGDLRDFKSFDRLIKRTYRALNRLEAGFDDEPYQAFRELVAICMERPDCIDLKNKLGALRQAVADPKKSVLSPLVAEWVPDQFKNLKRNQKEINGFLDKAEVALEKYDQELSRVAGSGDVWRFAGWCGGRPETMVFMEPLKIRVCREIKKDRINLDDFTRDKQNGAFYEKYQFVLPDVEEGDEHSLPPMVVGAQVQPRDQVNAGVGVPPIPLTAGPVPQAPPLNIPPPPPVPVIPQAPPIPVGGIPLPPPLPGGVPQAPPPPGVGAGGPGGNPMANLLAQIQQGKVLKHTERGKKPDRPTGPPGQGDIAAMAAGMVGNLKKVQVNDKPKVQELNPHEQAMEMIRTGGALKQKKKAVRNIDAGELERRSRQAAVRGMETQCGMHINRVVDAQKKLEDRLVENKDKGVHEVAATALSNARQELFRYIKSHPDLKVELGKLHVDAMAAVHAAEGALKQFEEKYPQHQGNMIRN